MHVATGVQILCRLILRGAFAFSSQLQGNDVIAEFDSLMVTQGAVGEMLPLEAWQGASAAASLMESSESEPAIIPAARTRAVLLSTAVQAEVLSAIPPRVEAGSLLVVQAQLRTPAHQPLKGYPVEAQFSMVRHELHMISSAFAFIIAIWRL